jgi:proline racemase
VYGGESYLIADSRAVGFDIAEHALLSSNNIGIFPCGGGTARTCK